MEIKVASRELFRMNQVPFCDEKALPVNMRCGGSLQGREAFSKKSSEITDSRLNIFGAPGNFLKNFFRHKYPQKNSHIKTIPLGSRMR